jgi:uncharacterized cupredoxin-like copper-binding protein
MKKILLASALTLSLISTATLAKEETAIGGPGDPGKVSRTVEITAMDNRFNPSEIDVKEGETIKFRLKNAGRKKHEMIIGTPEEIDEHGRMMKKFPDMEHSDEPNVVTVEPGKTGELIWHFAKAGTVDFACPLPGHFKGMKAPGMKGTIKVEAK